MKTVEGKVVAEGLKIGIETLSLTYLFISTRIIGTAYVFNICCSYDSWRDKKICKR